LIRPQYNVFDYYHETGCMQAIAKSNYFESATLVIIVANAIWMAVDTDYNKSDSLLEAGEIFQIAEHAFCIFFTFEWFVRFMSFENKMDGRKDGWFIFDSALVFMMVAETWVMTSILAITGSGGGSAGGTSILRLIRLLRLSRMVRMLRSVPELMILVKGMASAMKSVFYVMCLLLIFMYVFAIALTQMGNETDKVGEEFFSSVSHSMKTLLISGVFLDNLSGIGQAMLNESGLCLVAFFTFILLGNLTVMNMLIGVLCEVVSDVAKVEKEDMRVEFVTEKLRLILESLDANCDYKISKEEFRRILQFPAAVVALNDVGVDPEGIVDYADFIFDELMDESTEHEITFEDFMGVVLQLRGCNVATVKDCVDLRKFIILSLENMDRNLAAKATPRCSATSSLASCASLGTPACVKPAGRIERGMDGCLTSASSTTPTTRSPDSFGEVSPGLEVTPAECSRHFDVKSALESQKRRTTRLEADMRGVLRSLREMRRGLPAAGVGGGGVASFGEDSVTPRRVGGGGVAHFVHERAPMSGDSLF